MTRRRVGRRMLAVRGAADRKALPDIVVRGPRAGGPEEGTVDVAEIKKLDAYLKKLFSNPKIRVVPRPKKEDSAEVYIGEEFIGVLFVDDEDEDRSYNFQMAILEGDLE
jgi:hypothetical protein